MIKSIFLDIIKDPEKRDCLNFLKDKQKIYELFCESGYTKDFCDFEKELDEFLNSDEIKGVLRGDCLELSDDMLEMVSGGFALRKFIVGGVVGLMAVCALGISMPGDLDSFKPQQTQISRRFSGGGGVAGSLNVFCRKRKSEGDNVKEEESQQGSDGGEIVQFVMDELGGVLKKFSKIKAEEKNLRNNRQKDDNDIKKLANDELEETLEKFAKIRSKERKSKKRQQKCDDCVGGVV